MKRIEFILIAILILLTACGGSATGKSQMPMVANVSQTATVPESVPETEQGALSTVVQASPAVVLTEDFATKAYPVGTANVDATDIATVTVQPTASPEPYPAIVEIEEAVTTEGPLVMVEPTPSLDTSLGSTITFTGTETFGYRIVNEFPHDRGSYIQGLVFDDEPGSLLEGSGLWGESSLRRVDLETGEVTQGLFLPGEYFGEGITIFNDRIIQLTWKSGVGFVYDRDSFDLLNEFNYAHEGWGITHDGQQIIVSDGTDIIHFWDPETLQETGQIQVFDEFGPVNKLNELEFIDGEIFANVWQTDSIVRIDPGTGQVIGRIDLTGLLADEDRIGTEGVLNGIAYDPLEGRLYVTGKRWPKLFEIELIAADG